MEDNEHIPVFNIQTKKYKKIVDVVARKRPTGTITFITSAPHAGSLIPEYACEYLNVEDDAIISQMMHDSDPYTDLLTFTSIGALSLAYRLHRDIGDPNRHPDDTGKNGFLRTQSFCGVPLLKKNFTPHIIRKLQLFNYYYKRDIRDAILLFHYRHPHKPLLFVELHSMEPRTPALYDAYRDADRPDICIVLGDKGEYMDTELYDIVLTSMRKHCTKYQVEPNTPFDGHGNNYSLLQEHGVPARNRHAFNIEINKRLYLTRNNTRDMQKFKTLHGALQNALSEILEKMNTLLTESHIM